MHSITFWKGKKKKKNVQSDVKTSAFHCLTKCYSGLRTPLKYSSCSYNRRICIGCEIPSQMQIIVHIRHTLLVHGKVNMLLSSLRMHINYQRSLTTRKGSRQSFGEWIAAAEAAAAAVLEFCFFSLTKTITTATVTKKTKSLNAKKEMSVA